MNVLDTLHNQKIWSAQTRHTGVPIGWYRSCFIKQPIWYRLWDWIQDNATK